MSEALRADLVAVLEWHERAADAEREASMRGPERDSSIGLAGQGDGRSLVCAEIRAVLDRYAAEST